MAKTLQIIETAYRATVEEQDDPAVWITHAMRNAGAELGVLLRGNAVNYAVKTQNAAGLRFGEKAQTHAPDLARDLEALLVKNVEVYLVEEDLAERGLERTDLIAGLKPVSRAGLPSLLEQYSRVWHW